MTTASEPAWLTAARAKLGIRETPGPANNPIIMGWAKRLGVKVLGITYGNDSTVPWCGLFVAECMSEAGFTPPPIAVRASSWDQWGKLVVPSVGAVARFVRPGGGHVAFLVGKDDQDHFHVLGGNQGDRVSIMRLPRASMVACRWPASLPFMPLKPLPRMSASAGVPAGTLA